MITITSEIQDRLRHDLAAARTARRTGDHAGGWPMLEDAHVLSQPWATWHVRVHAAGLSQRDPREVWGQIVRVVAAAPALLVGRYLRGNTGRARVPATRPMPVPADLAQLLGDAGR